jgi:hypothetical protein
VGDPGAAKLLLGHQLADVALVQALAPLDDVAQVRSYCFKGYPILLC